MSKTLREALATLRGLPSNPFVVQRRYRTSRRAQTRVGLLGAMVLGALLSLAVSSEPSLEGLLGGATLGVAVAGAFTSVSAALHRIPQERARRQAPMLACMPLTGLEQALGRWCSALLPALEAWVLLVVLAACWGACAVGSHTDLARMAWSFRVIVALPLWWACLTALSLRVSLSTPRSQQALSDLLAIVVALGLLSGLFTTALSCMEDTFCSSLTSPQHAQPWPSVADSERWPRGFVWACSPISIYPLLGLSPEADAGFSVSGLSSLALCLLYWVLWAWVLLGGVAQALHTGGWAGDGEPSATPSLRRLKLQATTSASLLRDVLPLPAAAACYNTLLSLFFRLGASCSSVLAAVALTALLHAGLRRMLHALLAALAPLPRATSSPEVAAHIPAGVSAAQAGTSTERLTPTSVALGQADPAPGEQRSKLTLIMPDRLVRLVLGSACDSPFYRRVRSESLRLYHRTAGVPGTWVAPAVCLMPILCRLLYNLIVGPGLRHDPGEAATGLAVAGGTVLLATFVSFIEAAGFASLTLSTERTRDTWPLLVASGLGPRELVRGKLASTVYTMLGGWLVTLPFWALLALSEGRPELLALPLTQLAGAGCGAVCGLWEASRLHLDRHKPAHVLAALLLLSIVMSGLCSSIPALGHAMLRVWQAFVSAVTWCAEPLAAFLTLEQAHPQALLASLPLLLLSRGLVALAAIWLLKRSTARRLERAMRPQP